MFGGLQTVLKEALEMCTNISPRNVLYLSLLAKKASVIQVSPRRHYPPVARPSDKPATQIPY